MNKKQGDRLWMVSLLLFGLFLSSTTYLFIYKINKVLLYYFTFYYNAKKSAENCKQKSAEKLDT